MDSRINDLLKFVYLIVGAELVYLLFLYILITFGFGFGS